MLQGKNGITVWKAPLRDPTIFRTEPLFFYGNLNFNPNVSKRYDTYLYDFFYVSGWNNNSFATTYLGTHYKFIDYFLHRDFQRIWNLSDSNAKLLSRMDIYPKNNYIIKQDNSILVKLSE